MLPNVRTSSSTLSKGETAKLVCTPRILVGASPKAGVTSLMSKIPEACSWRLIVFAGSYATSSKEGLPQTLTHPPLMMEMVAIGLGLRPPPPSESFLYDEDHHYKWRSKSPSRKGTGNDAMSKALN